MNKRILFSLTGILSLLSSTAFAAHGWYGRAASYYDRARVLMVEPITTMVQVAVPRQECYQQEVHRPVYSRNSDGATLIGGIVGSMIGREMGHGRGGAAVAGAIIGAAVGRNMSQNTDTYYEQVDYVDRCDVHTRYQSEEQVVGYRVTYRYRGQVYTTRMDRDPGQFIQVRLGISPVAEY